DEEDEENSIECLAFCKSLPLLACATLNGQIFVWDLNTQTIRSKFLNENGNGYTKLKWNEQNTLYASTVNGCLQMFDGRNMTLLKKINAHQAEILDFCFDTTY